MARRKKKNDNNIPEITFPWEERVRWIAKGYLQQIALDTLLNGGMVRPFHLQVSKTSPAFNYYSKYKTSWINFCIRLHQFGFETETVSAKNGREIAIRLKREQDIVEYVIERLNIRKQPVNKDFF